MTSYTYKELTPYAQSHALTTWQNKQQPNDWWHEGVIEFWKQELKEKGFYEIDIQFSGFGSQGDGASFTAGLDLAKFFKWDAAQHEDSALSYAVNYSPIYLTTIPFDDTLRPSMKLRLVRDNSRYFHENTVSVKGAWTDMDNINDKEWDELMTISHRFVEDFQSTCRDMMMDIYNDLYENWSYYFSEEMFLERIAECEIRFNEKGYVVSSLDDCEFEPIEVDHTDPDIISDEERGKMHSCTQFFTKNSPRHWEK